MDLAWVDRPFGESAVPAVAFYPDHLLCSVCDLELEGQPRHANIGEMIDLPDAEPDIPEPDEDWLRGRWSISDTAGCTRESIPGVWELRCSWRTPWLPSAVTRPSRGRASRGVGARSSDTQTAFV